MSKSLLLPYVLDVMSSGFKRVYMCFVSPLGASRKVTTSLDHRQSGWHERINPGAGTLILTGQSEAGYCVWELDYTIYILVLSMYPASAVRAARVINNSADASPRWLARPEWELPGCQETGETGKTGRRS